MHLARVRECSPGRAGPAASAEWHPARRVRAGACCRRRVERRVACRVCLEAARGCAWAQKQIGAIVVVLISITTVSTVVYIITLSHAPAARTRCSRVLLHASGCAHTPQHPLHACAAQPRSSRVSPRPARARAAAASGSMPAQHAHARALSHETPCRCAGRARPRSVHYRITRHAAQLRTTRAHPPLSANPADPEVGALRSHEAADDDSTPSSTPLASHTITDRLCNRQRKHRENGT